MNWSAEQQRLLQALGHDLMVHGTQWPAVGVGAAVGAALAAKPLENSIAAKAAPTVGAPTPAHSMGKLAEAVRRAAGGSDISGLIDDMERLRNEPALKRALWPRLRALRRSH